MKTTPENRNRIDAGIEFVATTMGIAGEMIKPSNLNVGWGLEAGAAGLGLLGEVMSS